MKIIVDELPKTCKECQFNAPAMMRSPLGVDKEVNLCTLQITLTPPTQDNPEPTILDLDKSPFENKCLCIDNKSEAKIEVI